MSANENPNKLNFNQSGPREIVQVFNEMINNRDLDGLTAMMTEDHTFIDSSEELHTGKELMVAGWKDFFERYPDYKNHFSYLEIREDQIFILGHSTCSYQPLDGPAIWTARVEGDQVAEWRVYLDTVENRRALALPFDPLDR
jgi:ketosteroid isomerase-like protein